MLTSWLSRENFEAAVEEHNLDNERSNMEMKIRAIAPAGAGKSIVLDMFAKHLRKFGIAVRGDDEEHSLIVDAQPRDLIRAQAAQAQQTSKELSDLQDKLNTAQQGLVAALDIISDIPKQNNDMVVRSGNWLRQYHEQYNFLYSQAVGCGKGMDEPIFECYGHKHVFDSESTSGAISGNFIQFLQCSCGAFMPVGSKGTKADDGVDWSWCELEPTTDAATRDRYAKWVATGRTFKGVSEYLR
jgi:hypothetical protein